jgi:hypothetical protein
MSGKGPSFLGLWSGRIVAWIVFGNGALYLIHHWHG